MSRSQERFSYHNFVLCLESHVINFEDYGYTLFCHMANEDMKVLKQDVAFMPHDTKKEIEIHRGAGELGIKVFKVAHWKTKCKSYFNRYYKTSNNIMVPSEGDIIMNTLSSFCSDSKGRGFVFKSYHIAKHLEFLGYNKEPLKEKLGVAVTSQSISYIAYSEEKNVIFICEKVMNGSNMHQSSKNIAVMIKYFLTLYHRELQASEVKVIGLLIRGKGKHEELVKCKFCNLFSLSYEDFESRIAFENWWISIETYEGWWNLEGLEKRNRLFDDIAAEILCFMAVQEKGLPTLTDDKSQQFKQAYFLYTRQQMDIHFSDAKHVVIQGSYGSGKSLLGLKKLELISKSLEENEKIIYINFDRRSNLHFLMEKNVREYVEISSKNIKPISSIRDILNSPNQLIYVCHNSAGENLSAILQEAVSLTRSTSEIIKTNYHLIIEEYDGETLSNDEAAKITKLVSGDDLIESNIILLAQPLTKSRSWNIGKATYERETCRFHKLGNTFKIIKLEEVLRCSNKICEITKSTQKFVQNKDSVFTTGMDKLTFEEQRKSKNHKKLLVSSSVPESNYANVKTSKTEKVSDRSLDRGVDLDQAFERSASLRKSNAAKSKIVSKFGFLCEPSQGVDIQGLKPNLVEFSEDIDSNSDMAVISLALVLKNFIGKKEATTLLHMADQQPRILTRTIQLLPRLLDERFLCTQDIEVYLKRKKYSKMVFSSNFLSVNGMEFDHVVIVVSQSDYYLKYYLPQVISRCTYDLTFVLLPKDKIQKEKGFLQKFSNSFSRTRNHKTKETVANMIEELKGECLLKQVVVAECKACENNCYCLPKEIDNKQTFGVHTHSKQYKSYLFHLKNYRELEKQARGNTASAAADAK